MANIDGMMISFPIYFMIWGDTSSGTFSVKSAYVHARYLLGSPDMPKDARHEVYVARSLDC